MSSIRGPICQDFSIIGTRTQSSDDDEDVADADVDDDDGEMDDEDALARKYAGLLRDVERTTWRMRSS